MSFRKILPFNRIPPLRPLRPPSPSVVKHPRLFTQNTQLLLVARHTPRPQLPYLSHSSLGRQQTLLGPNPQLARLLSTETRQYVKEQIWLGAKWSVIIWGFIGLSMATYTSIGIEVMERGDPTPVEWSWSERQTLRACRIAKNTPNDYGVVDWAWVGSHYRRLLGALDIAILKRSELPEPNEDGIIAVNDDNFHFDLSDMSWSWRVGYYETVMGCAEAAEHLEGMVLDKTRDRVFPRSVMIGPSNPNPRPTPSYMAEAPLEENCVRPFEPAELYYMRALSVSGLSTQQKLDASMALANWLELTGRQDKALEAYKAGVDLAKAASPPKVASIVDAERGITKIDKDDGRLPATYNVLRALTGIASHYARIGDVSTALPIFLSVLRARRSAPVSSPEVSQDTEVVPMEKADADSWLSFAKLRSLLSQRVISPPSSTGDEIFTRADDKPTCEESELMLYIGEILFASASGSASKPVMEGIGWTRQAVTIAEANLQPKPGHNGIAIDRKQCRSCLATGAENWEIMLKKLLGQQQESKSREGGANAGWLEFRGGFGKGQGIKGTITEEIKSDIIEQELKHVEALRTRIFRDGFEEDMNVNNDSIIASMLVGKR